MTERVCLSTVRGSGDMALEIRIFDCEEGYIGLRQSDDDFILIHPSQLAKLVMVLEMERIRGVDSPFKSF